MTASSPLASEFKRRLRALQSSLAKRKLDAFIVYDRFNAFYLTGLKASLSYLLVTPRSATLLVDGRYIESAKRKVPHCEVRLFKKIGDSMEQWRREHTPRRIGLEGSIPYNQWTQFAKFISGVEWIEAGELILKQRLIKSAYEIKLIEASAKLNDQMYELGLSAVTPGRTEWDIRNAIRMASDAAGADGESFDSIIATGSNGSMPHYRPGPHLIKNGDTLLIDMGMLVNGYCSDMTRVVGVGKAPNPKMRKAFDAVLEAEEAALKAAGPGVKCSDLHKIATEKLKKRGLAQYFTHGLGHGVGLEIHEAPTLNSISADVLRPGMIITIEPGVYLPGHGGVRIEDLAVVTRNGVRSLSRSEKRWRIIPFGAR